jgi:hypothetical protein
MLATLAIVSEDHGYRPDSVSWQVQKGDRPFWRSRAPDASRPSTGDPAPTNRDVRTQPWKRLRRTLI